MTYLLVMLQLGIFQEQISPGGGGAPVMLADSSSVVAAPGSSTPSDAAVGARGVPGGRMAGGGDAFITASAAAFSVHALSELLAREIERDSFKW